MVRQRRWLWIGVGSVFFSALGLGLVLQQANQWYHSPLVGVTQPTVIEFASGESVNTLGQRLATQGIINHPRWWIAFARWQRKAVHMRAGEYQIQPGTTPAGLVDQLVEGRVLLHAVTLVEGWSFATARAAIESNALLRHRLTGVSDQVLMATLGLKGLSPEGQFFPDTYRVARGSTDVDFWTQAHAHLQVELAGLWQSRQANLPLTTPYEVVILASLIEKETAQEDERPVISAVFINRLRKGMRLQTDPTVIYGLGRAYQGRLHRVDLTTDTPYNTYTRAGLPPTPIALPGAAALHAAVQPSNSTALYFVASGTGDGRHVFSDSILEHNKAVQRYLHARRTVEATK
jgi:UPF0755 protein